IERFLQAIKWSWLVRVRAGRVSGGGECGVEQARLAAREFEIRLADRLQAELRAGWRMRPRAPAVHPGGHALSGPARGGVADSRQERVAIGEMAVGGIRDNADHARDFAQDDRLGAAGSSQLQASGYERGADCAAWPRPAAG